MIEQHPFRYFLPPQAHTLIMGSFPCFNGLDYGGWFYNGSGKNFLWPLLAAVFNQPAQTPAEQQRLCLHQGLALTDVAAKIIRTRGNCSDANLKILEINHTGIDRCLAAGISRILFTGRLVYRIFARHYPHFDGSTEVLISPSPAANRFIASLPEYRQLLAAQKVSSLFEYRLLRYRQAFLVTPA